MKIGKAKYGQTQKKYFKLADGETKFRILPPLGDNADTGIWSVFYKIHYGYKNTKGKLRVFQSSLEKNRSNGMIEVPDAADARIKDLKAKLEAAKAAGQKAVVEKLGPLVSGKKPMYNLDSNHYMNAIDEQGNIGVLKLRHNAKKALDVQIALLRKAGVDPLSADGGRYFVFTRTGTGLDTSFRVDVMKKNIEIQGVGTVQQEVVHVLDQSMIARLSDEAVDLSKLFRKVSAEQIQSIVDRSDLLTGQSPAIDEIFDAKADGGGTAAGDEGDYDDEEPASGTAQSTQAAAPQQAPVAAAPQTAAQAIGLVPASAPIQQAPTPVAVVETKAEAKAAQATLPATTAEVVADLSDADFLKSLGLSGT